MILLPASNIPNGELMNSDERKRVAEILRTRGYVERSRTIMLRGGKTIVIRYFGRSAS